MVIQTALWCSLFGCVGIFAKEEIKKRKNAKGTSEKEVLEERIDRTPHYTQLFTNLGLMNSDKGDWIKCIDVIEKKNYKLVKFKLSDSLFCDGFKKHREKIEEKMLTMYDGDNYKGKLSIYVDKGYMYFRVLNEHIDLEPYKFKKTEKHLVPLGTDLDDNMVYWNLKKDPHIKVIGATNSGKSRQQNIIISHIYNNIPNAPMWFMDFKMGVEFGDYSKTKNCIAYAEELSMAEDVLKSVRTEYEKRMTDIKAAGCRDYNSYIEKNPKSKYVRGFLFIDEFTDLMDLDVKATKDTEGFNAIKEIIDLARKCRAAGIHIVIGTQRPTADSIPSSMKNNVTGTIGMKTENEFNSRLVIDDNGCELLEQSHAIGILESKRTYFRSFYIEDGVMNEIVERFAKPVEAKEKVENKKKSGIK